MKRYLMAGVAFVVLAGTGLAVADLIVKDGQGPSQTQTMFDFLCFTSKHCSTAVPINSAGTEIGTASTPMRTQDASTATIATNTTGLATSTQMTTLISAVGAAIPAGTNVIGKVGIDQTSGQNLVTLTGANSVSLTGTMPALTSGSAVIGKVGIDAAANSVAITGALPALATGTNNIGLVSPTPVAAGSCTPYHMANGTAATTNSTVLRNAASVLCEITAVNTTATIYYLKIYDSASAPTCSSATNLKHVYPILPTGGLHRAANFGEVYAAGIGFCVTGGGGDTDNTSAATGVYIEANYK